MSSKSKRPHRRRGSSRSLILLAVVIVTATIATATRIAFAQCGAARSSCSACHDGEHAAFDRSSAWHADHAFADLCTECHGGHREISDIGGAHATRAATGRDRDHCATCHASDKVDGLSARYDDATNAIASSPQSPPGPTATPPPPQRPTSMKTSKLGNIVLAALLSAIAVGFAIWRRKKRDGSSSRAATFARIIATLRSPSWSPYFGGCLLGVLVTIAMAVFGHRLSGAAAYQHLSGLVGAHLPSTTHGRSVYWSSIMPPPTSSFTWDVVATIGTLLGAFVSSRLARTFRWSTTPDVGWVNVFGPSIFRRWSLAFLGSVLTEIGGGFANGCTASLAVSGGAVLAPAAFLFMAGMFAGGIPTMRIVDALATRRRKALSS